MPAMYRFLAHFSFTWLLGKALVRSVSCNDNTTSANHSNVSALHTQNSAANRMHG
jgi:hypothetical protein